MSEFVNGLIAGFFFGMGFHQIILQLAYRMGIVEYKGAKKSEQNKTVV